VRKDYAAKAAVSTAILLTGIATSIKTKNPEILGLTAITSLILYRSAEKTSNIHGRTQKIKTINSIIPNLIEYTALLTTAIHTTQPIILLTAVTTIGLSTNIKKEIKNSTNKEKTIFGRKERVTVLATALIATTLNQYFLIYGIAVLTSLTLIDLVYSLYKTTTQK